jgi:hypothetical protein
MDDSGQVECYIGKAPCGHYVYAAVDSPEMRDCISKDIARMIRQGFTIERKTVQWVRDGGLNFTEHEQCKKQKNPR